jgi:hypothetical protein
MYGIEVGTIKNIEFDLPAISEDKVTYFLFEMSDVDSLKEMQVALNNNILEFPESIINESESAFAYFSISKKLFKPGRNVMSFEFADNLNGTTGGYNVLTVQIWIAKKDDESSLKNMLDEKSVESIKLKNEDKEKYYTYSEDFSDISAGSSPGYLMKVEGAPLVVMQSDNQRYIRLSGSDNGSISAVHLFSSKTIFSAKVKVDDIADKGGVWLDIRFNLQDAYVVKCGYDFENSQWMIKDYLNHCMWIHEPVESEFKAGKWYDLKVDASGHAVKFYVDGKLTCHSNTVRNCNYGRIAVEAEGINVDFDDQTSGWGVVILSR